MMTLNFAASVKRNISYSYNIKQSSGKTIPSRTNANLNDARLLGIQARDPATSLAEEANVMFLSPSKESGNPNAAIRASAQIGNKIRQINELLAKESNKSTNALLDDSEYESLQKANEVSFSSYGRHYLNLVIFFTEI